ncbi:MAG: hypothetical protein JXK16_06295 [Thiotrichales bacterium]|nr:hypothetical protein [Thiotrichales bacterium]
MMELKEQEALTLVGKPEEAIRDVLIQKGNKKALLKYEVEAGFIVQLADSTEGRTYRYYDLDNEPHLIEIAEALVSNQPGNLFDKEIELYRWGVERPIEADEQSFGGAFRVLVEEKETGAIKWLSEKGEMFIADTLQQAKRAVQDVLRSQDSKKLKYTII